MNTQPWDTPPNGDFAAYVERLSARAPLVATAPHDGDYGFGVGMTPSPPMHGAEEDAAQAARGPLSAPGAVVADARRSGVQHNLAKVMAIVWVTVLVVLLTLGTPVGLVLGIFVLGLWIARRLRRWALPPGVANWRQWLEEEARKQKQRQQQGRSK